jgi:hypothetical protein
MRFAAAAEPWQNGLFGSDYEGNEKSMIAWLAKRLSGRPPIGYVLS